MNIWETLYGSYIFNTNYNFFINIRYPLQQASTVVKLIAGKSYYIEAVASNADGPNSLSVGAQLPNGLILRPMTGEFLNRSPVSAIGSTRGVENPLATSSTYQGEILTSDTTGFSGGAGGAAAAAGGAAGAAAGEGGGTFGLGTLGEINPSAPVINKAPLGFAFNSQITGSYTFK